MITQRQNQHITNLVSGLLTAVKDREVAKAKNADGMKIVKLDERIRTYYHDLSEFLDMMTVTGGQP